MEIISSKDNKRIKYIRSLLEKGGIRKKNHSFVVEGIKLVDEALEYGNVLDIIVSESLYEEIVSGDLTRNALLSDNGKHIIKQVKLGTLLTVVSDTVFKSVSKTITPQGILAVVEMPRHGLLEGDYLKKAYVSAFQPQLVSLEGLWFQIPT